MAADKITDKTSRPAQRRFCLGQLALYIEPRDAWVGAYVARDAVYVCLLPFVVLRWARG